MFNFNQLFLAACLTIIPLYANSNMQIDTLLKEYQNPGGKTFDADAGKAIWTQTFTASVSPQTRSCASCHTSNPSNSGKHVRTNKAIDPLAQSVNPQRFTDIRKIRKWLKRNCKWTLGRECTAEEKGNILTYLKDL